MGEVLDSFVGTVINTKIGGHYTILCWDGKITGKSKMYTISCPVCDLDKELNPYPYYTTKRDALKGQVPCRCSGSARLREYQLPVLVKRYLEHSCLSYVKQIGEFIGAKTKFKLYCKEHNSYKVIDSYSKLIKGCSGCDSCKDEKHNRRKEDSYYCDLLTSTAGFPQGTLFTRNKYKSDSHGSHFYWDVHCPVCSYDKLVIAGLCSGVFTAPYASLISGKKPCRCTSYQLNKEQAEFEIKSRMKELGYTFLYWEDDNLNYSAKKLFNYVCNTGHFCKSNYKKIIHNKYTCKFCNSFGYNKNKAYFEDYLYVLKFTNGEEEFIKIGRTHNMAVRFKEFKKVYEVELLHSFKGKHIEIFKLEQEIHKVLTTFHYKPSLKFKGSTECFDLKCSSFLFSCLEDYEKSSCMQYF